MFILLSPYYNQGKYIQLPSSRFKDIPMGPISKNNQKSWFCNSI